MQAPPLTIQAAGTNVTITWTATPTIFILQQTSSLTPPISWSAVTDFELLANGLVNVNLTAPSQPSFYRLLR
jgi:hypothetical protein